MIVLSAVLKAKAGKEKEMEDALKAMIPSVQNEEDALEYTLHVSQSDPSKFFYYEKYTSKEALDFHNSTPHFKELFSKLPELLGAEPEIEFYDVVDGIKR